MNDKNIPVPKVSEILKEEFMEPLNLSTETVAKRINVPTSIILEILHEQRKITVDISLRLGKLFGVSKKFFLNIQNEVDYMNNNQEHSKEKN
ncbi:MAG: HigA family addiction module antidote protein [Bacteroides sp.]|nr:HigA family addiction module antidote protein [Bacteroides sp.]